MRCLEGGLFPPATKCGQLVLLFRDLCQHQQAVILEVMSGIKWMGHCHDELVAHWCDKMGGTLLGQMSGTLLGQMGGTLIGQMG